MESWVDLSVRPDCRLGFYIHPPPSYCRKEEGNGAEVEVWSSGGEVGDTLGHFSPTLSFLLCSPLFPSSFLNPKRKGYSGGGGWHAVG